MRRVLLGVGNRLSRDDGIGPEVARILVDSDWVAIDCGPAIENAVGLAARNRPDLLVVVDAAKMGLPPGSIRRIPIRSSRATLSLTHSLSLPFVLDRMKGEVGHLILIGVEPADLSLGEGLSPPLSAAATELARILLRNRVDSIPLLPG